MYEVLNGTLMDGLPQLVELRVPYLDPSFEAMVRCQLKFAEEGYEKMSGVQRCVRAPTTFLRSLAPLGRPGALARPESRERLRPRARHRAASSSRAHGTNADPPTLSPPRYFGETIRDDYANGMLDSQVETVLQEMKDLSIYGSGA